MFKGDGMVIKSTISDLKDLGAVLRKQRKEKKLKQSDMLLAIGMPQQQYQTIEAGADHKVSTLLRIIEGLGLELQLVPRQRGISDAKHDVA